MNVHKSDAHIKDLVRHLIKTDRDFFKDIIKEVLIENEIIAPPKISTWIKENQPKPQRI